MRQRDWTIYSFIVDRDPKFAYEGYQLARSLIEHCCDDPRDVHVQFTEDVPCDTREVFSRLGCASHEIARFGDGRYCNKIAQLASLRAVDFDKVVLLDTDTIAISAIRPYLSDAALIAKVVDLPNPPIHVLKEIAALAGMKQLPETTKVDASHESTYVGNCNGGFYGIPKGLCEQVDAEWRRWALWLLDNIDLLKRAGAENHVDQVAMWLTIHMGRIPYRSAPSNVNYYLHFTGPHRYMDSTQEIALLHYHDVSLNVVGKVEPPADLSENERRAVSKANKQIGKGFESKTFWNLRYSHFLERGSGIGSRGNNIVYKRELLVQHGLQQANSVLDVGCGDLEVVKALSLRNYLGLDTSQCALEVARRVRPDWRFRQMGEDTDADSIASAEMVLCFEVLIHQPTEAEYRWLIEFLAKATEQTLIVSGYAGDYDQRRRNTMLFFYEPLEKSLRNTSKFRTIEAIGSHCDVTIFRCDV